MSMEKFIADAVKALNHEGCETATIVMKDQNHLDHIELSHYESENEDYYECMNDYLDGTMNV